MAIKDKIKREIEKLPDNELEKLYLYLHTLNKKKQPRLKIRSMKLQGKLDDKDIRSLSHQ